MKTLYLARPENVPPDVERRLITAIWSHKSLHAFQVILPALSAKSEVIFDEVAVTARVDEARGCDALIFLPFPEGGIHFRHGVKIEDERVRCKPVYEMSYTGTITRVERPCALARRFLSRSQTLRRVWSEKGEYRRPFF